MVVTITVSEPYVSVSGSWAGMRENGIRRTYRANVAGKDFVHTNKGEIQRAIRAFIYREENKAGFLHVPVKFLFVPEKAER